MAGQGAHRKSRVTLERQQGVDLGGGISITPTDSSLLRRYYNHLAQQGDEAARGAYGVSQETAAYSNEPIQQRPTTDNRHYPNVPGPAQETAGVVGDEARFIDGPYRSTSPASGSIAAESQASLWQGAWPNEGFLGGVAVGESAIMGPRTTKYTGGHDAAPQAGGTFGAGGHSDLPPIPVGFMQQRP